MVSPTLLSYYVKWNIFFALPDDAVDQGNLGVQKKKNTMAQGLNWILCLIIAEFA